MELNSGAIDCIWNGFTMNGRENDYTWSVPYVDNSQVVIVKKDSGINSLSDLAGKTVVVQADSSALAAFTGEDAEEANVSLCQSFKELQQVSDYNSAFMNLESGMVDAICMDVGVANYQVESRGDSFVILEEQVSSEAYGIGFKLGNTELRDQVQDTLKDMEEDGTFEEIAEKWGLSDSICLAQSLEESAGSDTLEESVESTDQEGDSSKKLSLTSIISQLGKGMAATLAIFVLTLVFSMPLGLLVAFVRMSKLKPVQWIAKIYISIMRGTPLMLQLLVVFFGPYYVFGVQFSNSYRFYAVIIGFALNYAAYFAEIYRSGIQSIPAGQREAAMVLGYNKAQTFFKIIFPQMVKRVMPPVTNEIITLVKDTSLAFALAYTEMFTLAKQIAAAQTSIIPLFVAGVFYYVFNFLVAFIMEAIEKKLDYYR
jgi:polar amino acid transport system substrate-binding protein